MELASINKTLRPAIITSILALFIFIAYLLGWLERAELQSLDLRFRLRGQIQPKVPILIVSIDEDSFDELDLPWPWPRTLHAELIRKLARSGARLIALDILFGEPKTDPREDRSLAAAIKAAGNVILAAELTEVPSAFGPRMSMSLPVPLIREHALAHGYVNLLTDDDGVVRRGPLAIAFQDRLYPSFASQIQRALAGARGARLEPISLAPYLINFRGPPRTYPIVPYYRVIRDEIDMAFFRDKIILVGAFAPSLHDVFPTPFSASQPTAGVEIHANLVETLLSNDPILPFLPWAHVALFALACAMVTFVSPRLRPLPAFAAALGLAGIYGSLAIYLFTLHQLWFPMVPSLVGIALVYTGITLDNYVREQKERVRLRTMFARYVSADVVEEILKGREELGLGGKRKHITVLFSDIRGFTSISEQADPEQVVSLLSDYLSRVTHIIFKNGGTVDKFMGDAVMAIFGTPKSYPDAAQRAVQTGLEMIDLADSLASYWTEQIGRPLKIGVGINSGDAVVGTIGSEIRSDFTAIGDTVNLASRLESLTKELRVPMLLSEFTASEVNGLIALRPLGQVKVTGRDAPLLVYCPEELFSADR